MSSACRLCGAGIELSMVDLGAQPLANDLRATANEATRAERFPLHARVCESCWLVQIADVVTPSTMFSDYPYVSSYSTDWLAHVDAFAGWAASDLGIGPGSSVVEIGSNDGCLLRAFVARGASVQGVDPAANLASLVERQGVPTIVDFFGRELAERMVADGIRPDLVVANNVFAHVPDIHDFVQGCAVLASSGTTIAIEVPHLLSLIDGLAFDTIYHEHHSYFSLATAERALREGGLEVVDVHRLPTHGGSLRLIVRQSGVVQPSPAIAAVRAEERAAGLADGAVYEAFSHRVAGCVEGFRDFLDGARLEGADVIGYGAPAKATVFLNAAVVTAADVPMIADRNPRKVGRFVPGSAIPIVSAAELVARRPRYVLILPWNIEGEVVAQLTEVRTWGGEFVVAVPQLRKVLPCSP